MVVFMCRQNRDHYLNSCHSKGPLPLFWYMSSLASKVSFLVSEVDFQFIHNIKL